MTGKRYKVSRAGVGGRQANPEGKRKAVQLSLPEGYGALLDSRAKALKLDRSAYVRQLHQQDLRRARAQEVRMQNPDAMIIVLTQEGRWQVELPDGQITVHRMTDQARAHGFHPPIQQFAVKLEGQQVVPAGWSEAAYFAQGELERPGQSHDWAAVTREAVARIERGDFIA